MSNVKKCDRCGAFYEIQKGSVALDVHIAESRKKNDDWIWEGWTEVDFCGGCSKDILEAIGTAIRR